MAKRPLKVFRTSAGFEDVYVAAPSRKAALAAWGTDKDLFARQAAEEVHDPELIKAPLAQPGNVVRLPRGTTAEHLAAAGTAQKAKRRAAASATTKEITRAKKHRPKPSKAKLERARAGWSERPMNMPPLLRL